MWLERTALLLGNNRLEVLKNARVLVVGLGGVGAYAAEMLCRSGIGDITIVDADVVQASNINRQLIASHSTIGKAKSELMSSRLKDINPQLILEAQQIFLKDESIHDILDAKEYDFVVDAIDSVSPKIQLIAGALDRNIPIISSLGAGGRVDLSQIMITDISKTYQCALARHVRKRLKALGYDKGLPVVFSPERVEKSAIILVDDELNKVSSAGTISYIPAVFGCYMASYVIGNI
ncbi:tRNA threonylcarbamoyladenosine dehydratase [Bacteroidales bacterium]|nr:tRNA threonylcarbamoyladenosine dehydratase [Bacteroidales bacterium]